MESGHRQSANQEENAKKNKINKNRKKRKTAFIMKDWLFDAVRTHRAQEVYIENLPRHAWLI